MQITLKQTDIVQALRLYVVSQGISLANKNLEVAFTAGRKGAGITADIAITSDVSAQVAAEKTDLTSIQCQVASSTQAEDPQPGSKVEAEVEAEDAPVVKAGTSLFSS